MDKDSIMNALISRRRFSKLSATVGAGMVSAHTDPITPTAQMKYYYTGGNVKTKAYAAFDESGELRPWEFERRPVGDNDILIEIKYASICHSDIHQEKGDWGKVTYPQVPGHEIVGIVIAVGKNVTKFKIGDRAGVGCMVDSCLECDSCKNGLEQHCDNDQTLFTYGNPDNREPTSITQGGYSSHIVVRDHFAVHIPENIKLQEAAPLLCAGITTYSPLMKYKINKGDKVGVVGIGGLGHLAVKIAIAKGAKVYAFTTTAEKEQDIRNLGVEEVIVVDDLSKLQPYKGKFDYMIATVPEQFDAAQYAATVKPFGYFTVVGMGKNFMLDISNIVMSQSRVNFNASLIGGIAETQELLEFCSQTGVRPQIQMISANQINQAWKDIVAKKARFRYVIDAATI